MGNTLYIKLRIEIACGLIAIHGPSKEINGFLHNAGFLFSYFSYWIYYTHFLVKRKYIDFAQIFVIQVGGE